MKNDKAKHDSLALKYAGGMGHTFVAIRDNDRGTSDTAGEYSSRESADRLRSPGERLYQRIGKRWARID